MRPDRTHRLAAIAALACGVTASVLTLALTIEEFPRGLVVLVLLGVGVVVGWHGLLRRGAVRIVCVSIAVAAFGAAIVVLFADRAAEVVVAVAAFALSLGATRAATAGRAELPSAPAPKHPVMIFNPRSGGGKAKRFSLAEEAGARGIEPIELRPGQDLERIVGDAVTGGADALAMAGGDGSQAVVAAIAAQHELPYACIPAGTRNHFALDLGVDREDVVGALDAFVDGRERRVDLADVNGRVFVNNVSLGVYAEAVKREEYRDAKVRTLLDTMPDALGPEGEGLDLRWTGPGGHEHSSGAAILVSNNRYRLGQPIGSGTRPTIDDGLLGITVAGAPTGRGPARLLQRPWREWSAPTFEVAANRPVPAGIDGETATLDPPLRFRIHPRALRVRVARDHPGASPSAALPEGFADAVVLLVRTALGRSRATQ
jgi:diacylglycerol kinase family enzyme